MFLYKQENLVAWDFIYPGIVGLVIYEILYRTQKWLSLKTLIIYVVVAIPIASWIYAVLYAIQFKHYEFAFSLQPFMNIFSAESYPYNLYSSIETVAITCLAYWIINTYQE